MAITEIIGEKTKPINNIGTSEKSKSKKLGKKGTLTLKYINTTEIPTSMLTLTLVSNLNISSFINEQPLNKLNFHT